MKDLISPQKRGIYERTALALTSAIVGFALGVYTVQYTERGCRLSDLTTEPDVQNLRLSELPDVSMPENVPENAEEEGEPPTQQTLPEKTVCLTFDDGPSKTTLSVLDVLYTESVPATFFVVANGYNDEWLPLIRRAGEEGHQIALHTATHEYKTIYQSDTAFWEDISQLKKRIAPYTDVEKITCLRFPGGSTNTVSRKYGGRELMETLKKEADKNNYLWVDWNVCAEDAVGTHPSAEKVLQNIIRETGEQKHCIVLMHDSATTGTTAEALPDIIGWYRENGYTFCTIDQMQSYRRE